MQHNKVNYLGDDFVAILRCHCRFQGPDTNSIHLTKIAVIIYLGYNESYRLRIVLNIIKIYQNGIIIEKLSTTPFFLKYINIQLIKWYHLSRTSSKPIIRCTQNSLSSLEKDCYILENWNSQPIKFNGVERDRYNKKYI